MKKRLTILVLILGSIFVGLPADGSAAAGQPGKNRSYNKGRHGNGVTLWEGQPRRRRRYQGRNRVTYGYKNYGQYRRTQVGNRRYRLVRRYYWRDGVRIGRWVRIYY